MMFFKVAEKSQNIWLTFASNFFDKKFKKRTIWSHCEVDILKPNSEMEYKECS